jgi:ABC-type bacteriocin/lantibiotic exporter with double-glycine peptidase domain
MIEGKESILTRVWNLLTPDRIEIRNIYIFAIFSGVISLGLPLGIQMIINFIQLGQLSASWFLLVGLVVAAIGFSGVMNILQLRITENLQQRIFTRSAFEFAYRIPKIKLEALRNYYHPEINARFFDTLTIQKATSKLLIDFMAASLQIVFGLGLLAFYHSFFIFFGVGLLFLLYIIIRLTSKGGYKTSLKESSQKYKVVNWLNEINIARSSVRNAGTNFHLTVVDEKLQGYINARKNHFRILVQQYGYLNCSLPIDCWWFVSCKSRNEYWTICSLRDYYCIGFVVGREDNFKSRSCLRCSYLYRKDWTSNRFANRGEKRQSFICAL